MHVFEYEDSMYMIIMLDWLLWVYTSSGLIPAIYDLKIN